MDLRETIARAICRHSLEHLFKASEAKQLEVEVSASWVWKSREADAVLSALIPELEALRELSEKASGQFEAQDILLTSPHGRAWDPEDVSLVIDRDNYGLSPVPVRSNDVRFIVASVNAWRSLLSRINTAETEKVR